MKEHMTKEQFNDTVNKLNSVLSGLDTGIVRESLAFEIAVYILCVYRALGSIWAIRAAFRLLSSAASYYRQILHR